MEFGSVELGAALGGVLAHSVALPEGRLKKGTVLGVQEIARLEAAGVRHITIARLGATDIDENRAAASLARAITGERPGVRLSAAFTGRVNVIADGIGLAALDVDAINAINGVDETITLATVPAHYRMEPNGLIATIKIIPYGICRESIARACELGAGAIGLAPVVLATADLIVTSHAAGSSEETGKGLSAISSRLAALGMSLIGKTYVPHEAAALAQAVAESQADLTLILTASATSDPMDVGPEALRRAGGSVTRFGIPVDPGNLLFYGTHADGRPVIGLPGCARSPAMNGADWVLERIAIGRAPTSAEIAAMGVGGLLKEMPGRKQPRLG
ncbi:MAG: molybdopterin-binding protein [Maritimibacter sp.]